MEDPSDISAGANIPDDLKADDLDLDALPEDDECIDNDDYSIPSEDSYHMPYDEIGGWADSAVYCTCSEDKCNGAEIMKGPAVFGVMVSIRIMLQYLTVC